MRLEIELHKAPSGFSFWKLWCHSFRNSKIRREMGNCANYCRFVWLGLSLIIEWD